MRNMHGPTLPLMLITWEATKLLNGLRSPKSCMKKKPVKDELMQHYVGEIENQTVLCILYPQSASAAAMSSPSHGVGKPIH